MKIITNGKKAVPVFFENSGIRSKDKKYQHPFITIRRKDDEVMVEVIDDAADLIKMPARTKVMAQWPGKNKSDYFKFTVGQLRKHVQEFPKKATQAI